MIHYQVSLQSPQAHLFQVTMSVPDTGSAELTLYMPAWIRGSYMIRDFAKNLVTLEARSGGKSLVVKKLDKQNWSVEPCDGVLTITYTIYAWDLSIRAAHLDTTHAYFNGPSLFLALLGRENEPCECNILPPSSKQFKHWRVATAMPVYQVDNAGFGTYRLPDYEALLDHPVEIGELDINHFKVDEIIHRFVVNGDQHRTDLARICRDLEKICSTHVQLFGDLPIDDYLFLLWVVGEGYGGLEHRNSTSLICSRDDLPASTDTEMTEGYRRLLGLCSHEYFHLWNVKRIMPAVFQANGMQQEVHTRQLWVFEGITSYYDELALIRSGVIDAKNYFELLAQTITRVMRGSGRLKQTLEESSFDAWTKFYKQDENAPNAIVSYYTKGAMFALALDLHIRLHTAGRQSLDDVMRQLWQEYGKQGVGLPERGFEQLAIEVTGLDLRAFFDLGLRSTRDLPLAELLSQFGVEMHLLPALSNVDKGRVTDQPTAPGAPRPVLGANLTTKNNELTLLQVFDEGAAQVAGLSAGDVIVAVDNLRLNDKQLEKYVASTPQGKSLVIHAFRRDQLMVFKVMPQPAPADTCVFHLAASIPSVQRARFDAWLHINGYTG
ncbi:MAG: PDZ domain-containing protein [Chromatiales bacterium]